MNFGLIEALDRALKKPAAELNEMLRGITEEQKETNRLLSELVRRTTDRRPTIKAADK